MEVFSGDRGQRLPRTSSVPLRSTSSTSGFSPVQFSWATTVAPASSRCRGLFRPRWASGTPVMQDPRPRSNPDRAGPGLGQDFLVGGQIFRDAGDLTFRRQDFAPGQGPPASRATARRRARSRFISRMASRRRSSVTAVPVRYSSRSSAASSSDSPIAESPPRRPASGEARARGWASFPPGARTSSSCRRTSSRRRRGRSFRRAGWPFPGRSRSSI